MRANQGFYKFKKDIKRIAYDTQAITGKVIDLRDNVDGYAVVGSTEGDMIKSVGRNLFNYNNLKRYYTKGSLEETAEIIDDKVVVNSNHHDYNGFLTGKATINVNEPCFVKFTTHRFEGVTSKINDGSVFTPGFWIAKFNHEGVEIGNSFSYRLPSQNGASLTSFYEISESDIDNGVSYIRFGVWGNGTTSGGPLKYDNLTFNIIANICYTNSDSSDIIFEPYKEDRKVCNQNDRCYINTFANGSVYSENDRTITVNFPKSMFASAYRAIANRVNNMDGDDYEEKTVNFFGDSITAGTNTTEAYHMWLSRYTGFHCKNWGVGGSGYIQELTGSFHTGDGIEGIAELKPQTGNNKILTIMKSVGELGNCMIFAGTNDWAAAYDIDAFRTAVQNTLDYAWEHSDRLLVLTPIKRYRGEVKNSAGKRLHEFSGVIIEECIKRGIPYIDGYEMPFDSNNDISALKYYAKEGVDKVHINEAGHKLMAGYLLDRFKAVFK